jgi:transposase
METMIMRFYSGTHQFYCGIDLHTRSMHVCIRDHSGAVVLDRNCAAQPKEFLKALAAYRNDIGVGVECTFSWYWLADLCREEQIPFVLGHALYMRLIHGGKNKNDRIDARKLALLLQCGSFPLAYAYPKGMRETRDLLRRRTRLVRLRAGLLTHIKIVNSQYHLPPLAKQLCYASNRAATSAHFPEGSVRQNIALDLRLIEHLEQLIDDVERDLVRTVKVEDPQSYQRLQTIPGVGRVLGLVLLYEMHDWRRFATVGEFLSYARLVRCVHESAGKKLGTGYNKIGNPHLKWGCREAACHLLQVSERAKKWKQRYEQKRGAGKALSVLSAKLGRAIYHLLRKQEDFDEERFWNGRPGVGTRPASAGRTVGTGV